MPKPPEPEKLPDDGLVRLQGGDGLVVHDSGPSLVTDSDPRCWKCDKKFAEYFTRPWHVNCERCKAANIYPHPSQGAAPQTS